MSISLLMVTKVESHAHPFLLRLASLASRLDAQMVLVIDGDQDSAEQAQVIVGGNATIVRVESKGYLESVLQHGVNACSGTYILRLDDDERCTVEMEMWLEEKRYEAAAHWKFSRAHMWKDEQHVIIEAPLWPDHQTRLSVKDLSGGRTTVHAGSPFGGGRLAPVILEHHKFLVKTVEERRAIAARYDAVHPGFGTGGFLPFNVPEEVYEKPRTLELVELIGTQYANA